MSTIGIVLICGVPLIPRIIAAILHTHPQMIGRPLPTFDRMLLYVSGAVRHNIVSIECIMVAFLVAALIMSRCPLSLKKSN